MNKVNHYTIKNGKVNKANVVQDKLVRIVDESKRVDEGNTRRSRPMKKIAEIKKAQKKLEKTVKNDQTLQNTVYLQDFMPIKNSDKTNKYKAKELKEARTSI